MRTGKVAAYVCREISLLPYTVLRAGETGIVVETDEALGSVTILMDEWHEGLTAWGNTALLAGPELASVELTAPTGVTPRATVPNILLLPNAQGRGAAKRRDWGCIGAWLLLLVVNGLIWWGLIHLL